MGGLPRPASPIVKWAGGKTRLLPEILKYVPEGFGKYYEPFFGGGALFFRLAPKRALLSDANRVLMSMYNEVDKNLIGVMRFLRRYEKRHGRRFYKAARDRFSGLCRLYPIPDPGRRAERAALFIYLNKTCYNGLWRVNSKGEFNVPFGDYPRGFVVDECSLRRASRALSKPVSLAPASFRDCGLDYATPGDFVYFDPPYAPLSSTSNFTSYTAEGFGDNDHRELAALFFRLADKGVHVLLSNSDTPFVRQLYRGARLVKVSCARSLNSCADGRKPVGELLIMPKR